MDVTGGQKAKREKKHQSILNSIDSLTSEKERFEDLIDDIRGEGKPKKENSSDKASMPLLMFLNECPAMLNNLLAEFEKIRLELKELLF